MLSFSMKHLLAETPRSNHTWLAHWLKRSPFSSGGNRRGIVYSRHRHGVEVLKVRRCLDLYSSVNEAEGPLTAMEAVPLAEIHALDIEKFPGPESVCKFCSCCTRHLSSEIQIISSPCNEAIYYWLELVSPILVFNSSIGPINCVRMRSMQPANTSPTSTHSMEM